MENHRKICGNDWNISGTQRVHSGNLTSVSWEYQHMSTINGQFLCHSYFDITGGYINHIHRLSIDYPYINNFPIDYPYIILTRGSFPWFLRFVFPGLTVFQCFRAVAVDEVAPRQGHGPTTPDIFLWKWKWMRCGLCVVFIIRKP